MKTRFILLLIFLMACSACTHTPVKPAVATEADAASAYIYTVENSAFGNATRVYWINPPRNKDLEKDG